MIENCIFVFDAETGDLLDADKELHEDSLPKNTYVVPIVPEGNFLQNMLDLQRFFQKRLGHEQDISNASTSYIMRQTLYAEAELHEMLRELENFKNWKEYNWSEESREEHMRNAREEFVDVLHFIWNIALALGFDSESIIEEYARKHIVNHARQDIGYGSE